MSTLETYQHDPTKKTHTPVTTTTIATAQSPTKSKAFTHHQSTPALISPHSMSPGTTAQSLPLVPLDLHFDSFNN